MAVQPVDETRYIFESLPTRKMHPISSNPAASRVSPQPPVSPEQPVASCARATAPYREVVLQNGDKFLRISQEHIFKTITAQGTIVLLVVVQQPEIFDIVGISPSNSNEWRILGTNRVSSLASAAQFQKTLAQNPGAIPSWLAKLWRPNDPKLKCKSCYQLHSVDGKRVGKRPVVLRVLTYNMLAPCYFRLRTARGGTRLESDFPVLYGRCGSGSQRVLSAMVEDRRMFLTRSPWLAYRHSCTSCPHHVVTHGS